MSWDCRTVTVNVSVRVHDSAAASPDAWQALVAGQVRCAVDEVIKRMQPAPDGPVEIEVI